MPILAYFSRAGGLPDPQGPLSSDKMAPSTIVVANKVVSAMAQY